MGFPSLIFVVHTFRNNIILHNNNHFNRLFAARQNTPSLSKRLMETELSAVTAACHRVRERGRERERDRQGQGEGMSEEREGVCVCACVREGTE